MPKARRSPPRKPPVDLSFRPASYTDLSDPVAAILFNIKGQRRREMIRDIVTGAASARALALGDWEASTALREVDPDMLEAALDNPGRLSFIHPTFLGGEFLPDYRRGEIEIARIVKHTTTMDVISIRARRTSRGFAYRACEEYESAVWCRPRTSRRVLTLGALLDLVFSLECDQSSPGPTGQTAEIYCNLDWELGSQGSGEESARTFFEVMSAQYPDLEQLADKRIQDWIDERLKEASEEESESVGN